MSCRTSLLILKRVARRGLLLSPVHPQIGHPMLRRAASRLHHRPVRGTPHASNPASHLKLSTTRRFTTTLPHSPTSTLPTPSQPYPTFSSTTPVYPLTPACPATADPSLHHHSPGMDISQLNTFEALEPTEPQHDTNTLVSTHAAQHPQLTEDEDTPSIDIAASTETAHLTFTDVPLSAVLTGKEKYGSAVHAVYDTDRISAAMALMRLFGIGAVLVRSTERPADIVGIVSTRDYIERVSDGTHPTDAPVTDYMTDTPIFAYSDEPAIRALELMTKHSFRHLPVRRRCCGGKGVGEVIGLVSIGDLVRVMLRQYRESNGYLKDFIDGKYR